MVYFIRRFYLRHPFLRDCKGTVRTLLRWSLVGIVSQELSNLHKKGSVASGSITDFGIKNKKKKFRNHRPWAWLELSAHGGSSGHDVSYVPAGTAAIITALYLWATAFVTSALYLESWCILVLEVSLGHQRPWLLFFYMKPARCHDVTFVPWAAVMTWALYLWAAAASPARRRRPVSCMVDLADLTIFSPKKRSLLFLSTKPNF